jgi:hypothetical protein
MWMKRGNVNSQEGMLICLVTSLQVQTSQEYLVMMHYGEYNWPQLFTINYMFAFTGYLVITFLKLIAINEYTSCNCLHFLDLTYNFKSNKQTKLWKKNDPNSSDFQKVFFLKIAIFLQKVPSDSQNL